MSFKKMIAQQAWIAALSAAKESLDMGSQVLKEEVEKMILDSFDDWWKTAGAQLRQTGQDVREQVAQRLQQEPEF